MTDFDSTTPRSAAQRLRTWEWIYLGYLLFVLAQPYFAQDGVWWEWPLAIALCCVTAVLYGVALLRGPNARHVWSSIVPLTVTSPVPSACALSTSSVPRSITVPPL